MNNVGINALLNNTHAFIVGLMYHVITRAGFSRIELSFSGDRNLFWNTEMLTGILKLAIGNLREAIAITAEGKSRQVEPQDIRRLVKLLDKLESITTSTSLPTWTDFIDLIQESESLYERVVGKPSSDVYSDQLIVTAINELMQ